VSATRWCARHFAAEASVYARRGAYGVGLGRLPCGREGGVKGPEDEFVEDADLLSRGRGEWKVFSVEKRTCFPGMRCGV
jgi:hypothetical protein